MTTLGKKVQNPTATDSPGRRRQARRESIIMPRKQALPAPKKATSAPGETAVARSIRVIERNSSTGTAKVTP